MVSETGDIFAFIPQPYTIPIMPTCTVTNAARH
jgi:hypothetical protein